MTGLWPRQLDELNLVRRILLAILIVIVALVLLIGATKLIGTEAEAQPQTAGCAVDATPKKIAALALELVRLTGPDNQRLEVNPASVVGIREPRGGDHFHPEIKCLLNTADGKIIGVRERCYEARALLLGVPIAPEERTKPGEQK
jgi:hypothetical protein